MCNFLLQLTFFSGALVLDEKRMQANRSDLIPCFKYPNSSPKSQILEAQLPSKKEELVEMEGLSGGEKEGEDWTEKERDSFEEVKTPSSPEKERFHQLNSHLSSLSSSPQSPIVFTKQTHASLTNVTPSKVENASLEEMGLYAEKEGEVIVQVREEREGESIRERKEERNEFEEVESMRRNVEESKEALIGNEEERNKEESKWKNEENEEEVRVEEEEVRVAEVIADEEEVIVDEIVARKSLKNYNRSALFFKNNFAPLILHNYSKIMIVSLLFLPLITTHFPKDFHLCSACLFWDLFHVQPLFHNL